jgi:hypothetical protein
MTLDRRQLVVLVLLTLVWGLNWPVMKLGVSGWPQDPRTYPPLTFRALSMLLGLPVLGAALLWLKVPFRVGREHRAELARLTLANMLVWHVVIIVALQQLSSGRAAILGYTMPIFAALWGALLFGDRLGGRQAFGVAAAALGVALLLKSEFTRLAGAPLAAAAVVGTSGAADDRVLDDGLHRRRDGGAGLRAGARRVALAGPARLVRGAIQRRRRVRLRARGMVLPGAHAAAGGVGHQRDADPGARHLLGGLGPRRAPALAGLGGDGGDGGGDRRRAAAALRRPAVRPPGRAIVAA